MKIEQINPKLVPWACGRGRDSKYSPIYTRIRNMKIGEAIRITLDQPVLNFSSGVYQNLRHGRVNYRIRIHKENNQTWCLLKLKKVKL